MLVLRRWAFAENVPDHFAELFGVIHLCIVTAGTEAESGVAIVGMVGVAKSDDRDGWQFSAALEGGEDVVAGHVFKAEIEEAELRIGKDFPVGILAVAEDVIQGLAAAANVVKFIF